jgi:hypothetical protein
MDTQQLLDALASDFTDADEMNTCMEDMRAANILAITMTRSALAGMAAATSHDIREITLRLPDYEPQTAQAMRIALLSLANVLQKSINASTDATHNETWAMRRLGITPISNSDE